VGIPEREADSDPPEVTRSSTLPPGIPKNIKPNATKQIALKNELDRIGKENVGIITALSSISDHTLRGTLKIQKSLNEIAISKASKELTVLRRKASTQDRARKKKKIQEQNGISVSYNTVGLRTI
jgi:hypothetical protein